MFDTTRKVSNIAVERGVSEEKHRLAHGIFTNDQIFASEMRHLVGPALRFRKGRPVHKRHPSG